MAVVDGEITRPAVSVSFLVEGSSVIRWRHLELRCWGVAIGSPGRYVRLAGPYAHCDYLQALAEKTPELTLDEFRQFLQPEASKSLWRASGGSFVPKA